MKTNLEKTVDSQGAVMVVHVHANRSGPIRFMSATNGARWYPESRSLFLGQFPSSDGKTSVVPVFIKLPEGDKPVEMTSFESSEPGLRVELKPDEDQSAKVQGRAPYRFTFTVPPGLPPASHPNSAPVTVRIKTSHPDLKELEIQVVYLSI